MIGPLTRVHLGGLLVAAWAAALVALGTPPPAAAQSAVPLSWEGEGFAARLQAALLAGPVAWDGLWARGARDQEQRLLDARSRALFDWFDVEITAERVVDLGERGIATDVRLHGTATWRKQAWGVASSFWTQQIDERFPSNHVVRRERWIRGRETEGMVARELLPLLDVSEARVQVGVYPGQNAMLVECSYHVSSRLDGVRSVRFLLDRRSHIYDLRVNGELVDLVRGNELGSLGLEGFSPEMESSFELPRTLARGEQALVKFRMRSPLVHMLGDGFVTSLPIRDGAFRERVWLPLLDGDGGATESATAIELSIAWPQGAYAGAAVCARDDDPVSEERVEEKLEERRVRLSTHGRLADLDFALFDSGVTLARLPDLARAAVSNAAPVPDLSGVTRFERSPVGGQVRTRAALLAPLLEVSRTSSRDLSSELQDLIPLDDDMLDELFDDSTQDAERGADDRQAG